MSVLKGTRLTRIELINLKKDERFIQKAISLLDEKFTVLLIKVKEIAFQVKRLKKELDEKIARAFEKLSLANMRMGLDRIDEIADTSRKKTEVKIREESFMGIIIPEIDLIISKRQLPDFGIFRTSIYLDEAEKLFSEILELVMRLSGVENSGYRLIMELKRTQKRLNALEFILLPDYNKTIEHVESILEESERDDLVNIKFSKEFLVKKQSGRFI